MKKYLIAAASAVTFAALAVQAQAADGSFQTGIKLGDFQFMQGGKLSASPAEVLSIFTGGFPF